MLEHPFGWRTEYEFSKDLCKKCVILGTGFYKEYRPGNLLTKLLRIYNESAFLHSQLKHTTSNQEQKVATPNETSLYGEREDFLSIRGISRSIAKRAQLD